MKDKPDLYWLRARLIIYYCIPALAAILLVLFLYLIRVNEVSNLVSREAGKPPETQSSSGGPKEEPSSAFQKITDIIRSRKSGDADPVGDNESLTQLIQRYGALLVRPTPGD